MQATLENPPLIHAKAGTHGRVMGRAADSSWHFSLLPAPARRPGRLLAAVRARCGLIFSASQFAVALEEP